MFGSHNVWGKGNQEKNGIKIILKYIRQIGWFAFFFYYTNFLTFFFINYNIWKHVINIFLLL